MEKFYVVLGFVSKNPAVVSEKAFVVTSNDSPIDFGYCDFYKINVFDSKELAEKHCDEFNDKWIKIIKGVFKYGRGKKRCRSSCV